MATKELFLLILVTVVIAISIAIALLTINSGETNPNRSAIINGMNEAIGRSVAYYDRPEMFGGGNHSFMEITLEDLYMDSVTQHGTFSITERTHTSFRLIGRPANLDEILTVVIARDSIVWE